MMSNKIKELGGGEKRTFRARGGKGVKGVFQYIGNYNRFQYYVFAATPLALIPKSTATLPLEPLDCAFIANRFKERFEGLQNAFVMLLDPVPLLFGEQ